MAARKTTCRPALTEPALYGEHDKMKQVLPYMKYVTAPNYFVLEGAVTYYS